MNGKDNSPLASGSTVIICLIIWLAFSSAVFALGPYAELTRLSGGPLLEETFGYTAGDVAARLHQLGGRGRVSYQQFQVLDAGNALLMAIALALALRFATTRLTGPGNVLRGIVIMPVLAAGGELVENWMLLGAIQDYPADSALALHVGMVTLTKLVLGFGSLLLVVLSFAALAGRWAVRRLSGAH